MQHQLPEAGRQAFYTPSATYVNACVLRYACRCAPAPSASLPTALPRGASSGPPLPDLLRRAAAEDAVRPRSDMGSQLMLLLPP